MTVQGQAAMYGGEAFDETIESYSVLRADICQQFLPGNVGPDGK